MLSKRGLTPLEILRGSPIANMRKTKKFLTGFTLIELLVVIAIIGLLASIVLVSFPSATKKAKDARIIASLSQARNEAAGYYIDGSTYTGYTITAALSADITAKGGTATLRIDTNGSDYCMYSGLNNGGYYCADSAGKIGKIATDPGATGATCAAACVAASTCACPTGTTL